MQLVTVPVTAGVWVVIANPFVNANGEPEYMRFEGAIPVLEPVGVSVLVPVEVDVPVLVPVPARPSNARIPRLFSFGHSVFRVKVSAGHFVKF